jgi:hypothetical protein
MADIILTESQYERLLQEAKWYNLVGDVLGIIDPTGIVDVANGISYMYQGDHLFGILSFISAIPIAGDVVAKPVMGALKIGSTATKELKIAMDLAKAGKTVESAASLEKLAKQPGVVGKFLRGAESWAPKIAEKVERLPGGIFKGLKNTILDYLKLFERAGAKSAKFASEVDKFTKNVVVTPAKQAQNIKALQDILKTEKIFDKAALTNRTLLSNIFMGGAPRLFGNRILRMLMRSTKFWLGFLDYVGMGNFVGPDEAAAKLGGEEEMRKKFDEYMKTKEARNYAYQDFGNDKSNDMTDLEPSDTESTVSSSSSSNPFGDFLGNIFQSQLGKAAVATF